MNMLFYAALTLLLHLEAPQFPVVLLPFIFPQEELSLIAN